MHPQQRPSSHPTTQKKQRSVCMEACTNGFFKKTPQYDFHKLYDEFSCKKLVSYIVLGVTLGGIDNEKITNFVLLGAWYYVFGYK